MRRHWVGAPRKTSSSRARQRLARQTRAALGPEIIFSSELAEAGNPVSFSLEPSWKPTTKNLFARKTWSSFPGAASQQEEEEVVEAMHAGHESYVRAALDKLKLRGASDQQIAALKQAEHIDPNFVLPAPITGVVLTRAANLGLVVSTAQESLRGRPVHASGSWPASTKRTSHPCVSAPPHP